MDYLRRMKGDLAVLEYRGLDKLLIHEAEKLKKQIQLLEEMELQLAANAAFIREKIDAR